MVAEDGSRAYERRFREEFGDLLQARLMPGQANLKGYDEMYRAYTHARPYLFDVRIFDERLRTAAFRVLERLRAAKHDQNDEAERVIWKKEKSWSETRSRCMRRR
ncbi:hypothetical protein SAEN111111_06385 [Saccharibacillus endophyticus]